jgi:flagellin-like hook-associated protein FlgL
MIGGTNPISSQLVSVYKETTQSLNEALTKLATGKKFQNAAEDIIGFTRAVNLNTQITSYEELRQDLTEAKMITSAAVAIGGSIYENLTKLKDFTQKYINEAGSGNDPIKLAGYKIEIDSLKTSVVSALQNSYVDGTLITQSGTNIKTYNLDPDRHTSLSINFSGIANHANISAVNTANISNTNSIQDEIRNSLTYLSEAKSFNGIVDKQINLVSTIINSKQAAISLITDIDDAEVTTQVVDLSIRYDTAVAMIAQGNMLQNSLSRLYNI